MTKARRRGARPRGREAVAPPIRVGLLGFGTIGTGVLTLLRSHRAEIARRAAECVNPSSRA